eukprot:356239-Chlamydomonas_euryale.AAC.4
MILKSLGSRGSSFLDAARHDAVAQAKRIAEHAEAAAAVQASRKQSKMKAFMTQLTPDQQAGKGRCAEHERKGMQRRNQAGQGTG